MRDLSKTFSEQELRWIISQLQDIDLSEYDEDVFDEVEEIVKYVGAHELSWVELGFFIKLVEMNPNYKTDPIRSPKLKTMDVILGIDVTERVYEKWEHTVQTYLDKDDVDMVAEQIGERSYWEGTLIDKDYYDTQVNEENIEDITIRKSLNK